jgi:hypothetical protein
MQRQHQIKVAMTCRAWKIWVEPLLKLLICRNHPELCKRRLKRQMAMAKQDRAQDQSHPKTHPKLPNLHLIAMTMSFLMAKKAG